MIHRKTILLLLLTACFAGCCAGAAWLYLHPNLPEAGSFSHMLLGMAIFFAVPTALLWSRFRRQ